MTSAVSGSKPVELAIHLVLKDAELVNILPASLENYAKNGGRLLGETPHVLSIALWSRNIKGFEVLIQHAKDNRCYYGKLWSIHPDRVISSLVNEAETSTGLTPLHIAAKLWGSESCPGITRVRS
ncbi:hypothetical protein CGMCC3_g12668 [Colletotrichum fructicola]|nr:uncharacterized protein CGMCC3_g12668 [Colletotrichum fructicola]KAE9571360.1 hypothetical protein CGMCC3_g12668 [Colletotrichum fructicola]